MIPLFIDYNPDFYESVGTILFSLIFIYAIYRIVGLVWRLISFIRSRRTDQERETEFVRTALLRLDEHPDWTVKYRDRKDE